MKASILFDETIKYDHTVNEIKIDSREVSENDVFYCIKGSTFDGVSFIDDAIKNGAKTIVLSSDNIGIEESEKINYIYKDNLLVDLSVKLYQLHKYIFKKIKVISVTGTNGKTTITTLLYKYLRSRGINTSLIGTNGNFINEKYYHTNNTTDDICTIYKLLKLSYVNNVKYFIMESSSHAIKGMRIRNIPIEVALYTNLSLDHLDYHKTMDDYMYTKLLHLKDAKVAILNKDDKNYALFNSYLNNTISFGSTGDILIDNVILKDDYSKFNLTIKKESYFFKTNLLGRFNIENIAGFVAILVYLKLFEYGNIYTFLKQFKNVVGRMEMYKHQGVNYYIDFAHTPDGVDNVLGFLNTIKKRKIITVIGCGGSRDKLKREKIGEISSSLSDYVIYTTDNPRDEDEVEIINEIIKGVKKDNYEKIVSRKEAILKAFKMSEKDDIVAILGKGNEKYILKKGVKIPYNDKEYLLSLFNEVS